MDANDRQVEQDLQLLRERKEAWYRSAIHRFLGKIDLPAAQDPTWMRRVLAKMRLDGWGRWVFAIVPIAFSWAYRSDLSEPDPWSTAGTFALVVILLQASRLERNREGQSFQAGFAAGATAVAVIPAGISVLVLLLLAGMALLFAGFTWYLASSVPWSGFAKAVVVLLMWWAPLGLLATCSHDALRAFEALRQRPLRWRDYSLVGLGLALAVPTALTVVTHHLGLLGLFGSDFPTDPPDLD